ncbi:MAG: hypothetical protein ABL888_04065 [Pirellulaceae bacterium]
MFRYRALILIGLSLFLIAGRGFAQANTAKQTQSATADEWQTISPEGANASFQMPGQPEAVERKMNPVKDQITTVHLNILALSPTNNYVFAYNEVPRMPDSIIKLDETLDGGVKGALIRTLGDLKSVKKIKLGNYLGRDFVFECVQGEDAATAVKLKVASRLILINGRMYQLTYVSKLDEFSEKDSKKFVESFTYIPPPAVPATGNDDKKSTPEKQPGK